MQAFKLLLALLVAMTLTFGLLADAHRFHRAMVFTGSGFEAAPIFLGMLQAAEDAGKAPDVLVTSCGGSFAAELALRFPDSAQRLAFMTSPQIFSVMTSIDVHGHWSQIAKLAEAVMLTKEKDWVPPIFTTFLLNIPQNVFDQWQTSWTVNPKLSAVVVAGQALFKPQDVFSPRKGRKLFKEIYFTDQATARALAGFESPMARQFPDSPITLQTMTLADWPMGEAIRASVSDPFVISLARSGAQTFVTGTIDLYPLEVAHQVADEVLMPFKSAGFWQTQFSAMAVTFRINYNQRLAVVNDEYADFWIDSSDETAFEKKYSVDPSLGHGGISFNIGGYDGFVTRVKALWNYGYSRTQEALARTTRNDKTHIRDVNSDNSSAGLRLQLAHAK